MKFSLQSIANCSGRLGTITDIERLPGLIFETPMLFLHTKGGVVPHLSHEVLQMVTTNTLALQLPLTSTLQCHTAVSLLKKPLIDFIGMKCEYGVLFNLEVSEVKPRLLQCCEYGVIFNSGCPQESLAYCSIQDTSTATPSGYNGKTNVSIWTKAGRECIDAEKFMDVMETFQPDVYQALCDGDTNAKSTRKRIMKSIDSTHEYFMTCLQRHKKSEKLKNSALLATLEGGYDLGARSFATRRLAKQPVMGFVIDGLDAEGEKGEKLDMSAVASVVKETLALLPDESLRVAPGCWNPRAIVQLVDLGVDAFDTSLVTVASDRGSALVFDFETLSKCAEELSCDEKMEQTSGESGESSTDEKNKGEPKWVPRDYEINLRNEKYRDVIEPLLAGCECLACKNHTKAYVHHLLMTQELLAPILLMIHNLHHYFEFFKDIRQKIRAAPTDSEERS